LNKKIALLAFAGVFAVALPVSSALADSPPHVDTSGDNLQPAYPASALPGNEAGAVVVDALVRENGTVKRVTLRKTSGFDDLDTAAVNAVKGWKFSPAIKGGSSAEDWASVQIVFQPPTGTAASH
jgi:protein TonB